MNDLRKKREARRKATKKAIAKREFARRHSGLNIWEVSFFYIVFGICGGGAFFFWFLSILSMGA